MSRARRDQAGEVEVHRATPRRWPDVVSVFGTRGAPSWCWCQFFTTTGEGYTEDAAANKAELQRQVGSRAAPFGLVAYLDGTPAGWLQLGPRGAFPRITGNRAAGSALEAAGVDDAALTVWRTTCFVVRVGARRSGVARALLDAAVAEARSRGADVLEGHPVDVEALTGKPASANLYHGVLSTYLAAGFSEVGRTGPSRPIVRLPLTASGR